MSEPIQPPSHLSASADDVEDNTIMPPPINAEETHPLVVPQGAPVDVADEKHVDEVEHADDAKDAVVAPVVVVNTPKVNIKILVISGQTHMYSFEPETTIGRVKELIWNMWPPEWNKEPSLPATPSYFRLLYLGRVLADEQTLSGLGFKLEPHVTIVHLSVRTFPIAEDDGHKKSMFSLSRPSASRAAPTAVTPNAPNAQPSTHQTRRHGSRTHARHSGAVEASREDEHGGGCRCVVM